jgi:hypothetical protein
MAEGRPIYRKLSRATAGECGNVDCAEHAFALLHISTSDRYGKPIYRVIPKCKRHTEDVAQRFKLSIPPD